MASTPSFFSRAHRPAIRLPTKSRGFLALPGEIRNQIYQYYFESGHHYEVAAQGARLRQQRHRTVKLGSALTTPKMHGAGLDAVPSTLVPSVARFSSPLGKYNVIKGLQTNWLSSRYALSLVCRQVYAETATFLYRTTVFVFGAPRRIQNFLDVVSGMHLENITMLQLHYDTYGHLRQTEHVVWQDMHRQSWFRACKAMSKNLTGLHQLEIWVQLHDSAPKFTLRDKWITPLLQFRRLTCAQEDVVATTTTTNKDAASPPHHHSRLRTVKVHVQTCRSKSPLAAFSNNRQLAQASTHLHVLYGRAVSLAISGAREDEAMAAFNTAWEGEHTEWRHHLQFAQTGW